ncbi:MAG: hypothetical protein AAFQ07_17945 [Chloroflexota bacterium]
MELIGIVISLLAGLLMNEDYAKQEIGEIIMRLNDTSSYDNIIYVYRDSAKALNNSPSIGLTS